MRVLARKLDVRDEYLEDGRVGKLRVNPIRGLQGAKLSGLCLGLDMFFDANCLRLGIERPLAIGTPAM